jgi:hypothetical protein
VFQLKDTLNDLWVFDVRNKQWQPIYPNNVLDGPGPTESPQMITLKPDRLVLMFGGQYGEVLRDELWLYNINTN